MKKFYFLGIAILVAMILGCPEDPETKIVDFVTEIDKLVITVGDTAQLKTTIEPAYLVTDGLVSYSYESDNAGVVSVDENGVVKALAVGKAKIYTRTKTKNIFLEVSVVDAVTEVVPINAIVATRKNIVALFSDSTVTLEWQLEPANTTQKGVVFSSSDNDIATVDENGVVTAVVPGSVTILISSSENAEIYDQVVVTFDVEITGISAKEANVNIDLATTKQYQIEFEYLPNNTTQTGVTFTSTATNVATVDQNGLVSFLKTGNATVKIASKINASIYDEVVFTITGLSGIIPSQPSYTIAKGDTTCKIAFTYDPADTSSTGVTFSSSNEAIATVAADGTVTKQSNNGGSVIITIRSTVDTSISATVSVNVTPVEITSPSTITLTNSENNNLSGEYTRVGVYEFDNDATYANFASSGSEYLRIKGSVSDGCYIPAAQSGVRFKPSDISGWTYFEVRVRATTRPNFFASAENSTPFFNGKDGISEPADNGNRNIFTFVRPGGSGYQMGIKGGNDFGFGDNPGAVTYTNDNTYYTLGYLFDETNMKVYCYSNSNSEFCSSTPIPAGNFIPTLCNGRKYFNIGICEQDSSFNNGIFIDYIAVYKKN